MEKLQKQKQGILTTSKEILINGIKDFNPFVKDFIKTYRREPLDYDELFDYLKNHCDTKKIIRILADSLEK